jgi:hypothetical protein
MIFVWRTTRIGYNREVTIKTWLEAAIQDAERRNLAALRPMLETLARATSALRSADWNADATGEPVHTPPPDAR